MNYLFFDIECANSFNKLNKICEFGYIITNEHFKELEREIILINPDDSFDVYILEKMLAYKAQEYTAHTKYPANYEHIKKILLRDDIKIFGHTVDCDARYLNDESKRWNLPFINFKFYDVKYLFYILFNADKDTGLAQMLKMLNIPAPQHAHRSVDDAISTMKTLKAMCEKKHLSIEEVLQVVPDCSGETTDGVVTTRRMEIEKEEALKESQSSNKEINPLTFSFGDLLKEKGFIFDDESSDE